jgi:ribosomal protein S18 acetylase RimI-like enzyme
MTAAIRPARDDDYDAFVALFPELHTADETPSRARWCAELAPQSLVAERDGAVVGYLFGEALTHIGYVRQLAVASGHRRQGVGRALMRAAADRFRTAGCHTWCLNVRPHNEEALALYTHLGMQVRARATAFVVDWGDIARLPPSPPCVLRAARVEDDDAITRVFALPEGQLAHLRRLAERVHLVALGEDGGVEAYACFDPGFPGAFPFRVRTHLHLRAMLEALRPHARAGDTHLRLVAEDGSDEVEALIAAGAEVAMEFVHLDGPIPQGAG